VVQVALFAGLTLREHAVLVAAEVHVLAGDVHVLAADVHVLAAADVHVLGFTSRYFPMAH